MVPLPDATAEFRILGPLEIATGTGRLELGGARQKIVLATLLLSANRVVTLDRLLEALYGGRLAATARAPGPTTISSLRHLLATDTYGANISAETNGYIMNLDPERLDVHRFENMVAAARQAAADGPRGPGGGGHRAPRR